MGRRGHRRTGNRPRREPDPARVAAHRRRQELPHHWVCTYLQGASRSWTSPASPPRRTSNATSTTLLNRTGAGRGPATSRWRRHGLPPSGHLAEALQRLDHLTDLADDLVQGRLYLPQHDLDHCDASLVALQQGDDIPATRALITLTCRKTRKALTAAHALLDATAPRFQPLRRALQLVRDVNDTPTGEARNGFVPERLSRSAACPRRAAPAGSCRPPAPCPERRPTARARTPYRKEFRPRFPPAGLRGDCHRPVAVSPPRRRTVGCNAVAGPVPCWPSR
ncbi:squalene/phytoene synthase family protein [Streptomyces bacillaris]|uniref:squalene/phytoene synthase family protein n=1 Tax=Streptomyces bacillaris TaxID=68179 RepID=UPI0036D01A10